MFSISTRSWLISHLIICTVLLAPHFPSVSHAQVMQTNRFEVPVEHFNDFYDIVPSSGNGLFLYRQLGGPKEDQIHLIKLDSRFQQDWAGFITLENNYRIMGTRSYNEKLFVLLRYRDYSRNDMLLYIVNEAVGTYVRYQIRGYIPFAPTEFQITDEAAIIGGYYNRIPVVLHYSLSEFRSKVLPGLFNDAGELTQVKTHADGSFDVLISARNYARQRTIWIKSYDPEGNLLRNLPLQPQENKHLIFGRSLKTAGDKQIVAGVYANHRSSEYSRGMFIATVDPSGMEQIRYYNFGDLKNFFQYMKANREKRIKHRIERKKIKGKKIKFNYRFLVHELVPYKDQFVMLGEAFYPRYLSADRSQYPFFTSYGSPHGIAHNGRIFDGYHYTHAVVMGFDENGDLLWDNSFEINDVKTYTLEQFVKLKVLPDRLALMYVFDNHIRTKIIKGDRVLEGKSADPITTFHDLEIVRNEKRDVNKLEYWYDQYLYAYGVQDIASPAGSGMTKRRVFFINKVHYPKDGE
jgi:hypothetical protein